MVGIKRTTIGCGGGVGAAGWSLRRVFRVGMDCERGERFFKNAQQHPNNTVNLSQRFCHVVSPNIRRAQQDCAPTPGPFREHLATIGREIRGKGGEQRNDEATISQRLGKDAGFAGAT